MELLILIVEAVFLLHELHFWRNLVETLRGLLLLLRELRVIWGVLNRFIKSIEFLFISFFDLIQLNCYAGL